MTAQLRTITHKLTAAGAAHDDDGRRINPLTAAGTGRARCACGAMSEPMATRIARRAWHLDHQAYTATESGQRDDLAETIRMDYGMPLVTLVREEGPDAIERHLAELDEHQLRVLAVGLAAMVPDDRSDTELMAWVRESGLMEAAA